MSHAESFLAINVPENPTTPDNREMVHIYLPSLAPRLKTFKIEPNFLGVLDHLDRDSSFQLSKFFGRTVYAGMRLAHDAYKDFQTRTDSDNSSRRLRQLHGLGLYRSVDEAFYGTTPTPPDELPYDMHEDNVANLGRLSRKLEETFGSKSRDRDNLLLPNGGRRFGSPLRFDLSVEGEVYDPEDTYNTGGHGAIVPISRILDSRGEATIHLDVWDRATSDGLKIDVFPFTYARYRNPHTGQLYRHLNNESPTQARMKLDRYVELSDEDVEGVIEEACKTYRPQGISIGYINEAGKQTASLSSTLVEKTTQDAVKTGFSLRSPLFKKEALFLQIHSRPRTLGRRPTVEPMRDFVGHLRKLRQYQPGKPVASAAK